MEKTKNSPCYTDKDKEVLKLCDDGLDAVKNQVFANEYTKICTINTCFGILFSIIKCYVKNKYKVSDIG